MKSISMKNINDTSTKIEVIRYFINNDIEYLIYSLNEIDDAGYTKLYASKILDNKATIISDEEEWLLIKEIIKQTVKNNRDGNKLDIIDLDEKNLKDVVLVDTRVFKLQGNLVNLLAENKNIRKEELLFEEEVEEEVEQIEDEIEESEEIETYDEEDNEENIEDSVEEEDNEENVEDSVDEENNEEFDDETVESDDYNEEVGESEEINNDIEESENEEINYEKLYNDILDENILLKNEIDELKAKIDKIKEILE